MIRAEVIYFPTYFGHVGIKVKNSDTAEELFYDFGGCHSFGYNCKAYCNNPITIKLPDIDTDWNEFVAKVKTTCYDTSNIAADDPKTPELKNYNILTNNCAHATQQILHMAGYIETQPARSFAFTPYQLALQANALALGKENQLRDNLLATTKNIIENPHVSTKFIQQLVTENLDRLREKATLKNKPLFKMNDRYYLMQIDYDGSLSAIKRLLHATELASPSLAQELQKCIVTLPPEKYLPLSIERLNQKASALFRRGYKTESLAARQLAGQLNMQVTKLKDKQIAYPEFQHNCNLALEKAMAVLAKQRSMTRILGNIALAIAGAGVLYLLAASINKKVTGNFLFFKPSETKEIVLNIAEKLKKPGLGNL